MNNLSVRDSSGAYDSRPVPATGTVRVPRYYDGPEDVHGDVILKQRYFTYRTDMGIVAGCDMNVMFTLDRPARVVWPYVKDFNLWQNSYGHYYSGVLGDLYSNADLTIGSETFRISDRPNDPGPHQYVVLRVIPERLVVVFQPVPDEDPPLTELPGLRGVSPGFHVVMLSEQSRKTAVSILMEHASLMKQALTTEQLSDEEAIRPWRQANMAPEWLSKWRDNFIPKLTKLVYEDQS